MFLNAGLFFLVSGGIGYILYRSSTPTKKSFEEIDFNYRPYLHTHLQQKRYRS